MGQTVTPLEEARLRAHLTKPQLARRAGVSLDTVKRALMASPDKPPGRLSQQKIVDALNATNGTSYERSDFWPQEVAS